MTDERIPWKSIDQQDDLFYDLLESVELKPCPFCGSDDLKKAIHLKGQEVNRPYHLYSIWCCNCGVSNSRENPRELFDWWNAREA